MDLQRKYLEDKVISRLRLEISNIENLYGTPSYEIVNGKIGEFKLQMPEKGKLLIGKINETLNLYIKSNYPELNQSYERSI